MLERDVLTCSHCERAVVLQPLRTRDRGFCQKCNHYVCDDCEAIRAKTGICTPMRQILDRLQGLTEHGHLLGVADQLPAAPLALAVQRSEAHYAHWDAINREAGAKYDEADWDGAEPYLQQMLEAGISLATVYATLSVVTFYQGKREEAQQFASLSVMANPDRQLDYDNLVMFTDADPKTTPAEAQRVREVWWEHIGAPQYAKREPLTNDRDPNRRLRVGYCSGDFCNHSACSVFGPFVLNHSADFEAFFYSSTETKHHDVVTDLFKASPNWRDVWGESIDAVAALIQRDRIDLLVDLSGYTANNRLSVFARKTAPVQITGWGYGTGLSWPVGVMDYLVADATVVPPNHADITEQIALLPSLLSYFPTDYHLPDSSPLPSLSQPPTFGVFQRSLKINDECLQAWALILERLPIARMIIKGDYCRSFVEHIQRMLAPVLERVAIINVPDGKQDHLARWRQIDVALDTWPQSGGVASCEALWHGVPIVTYQGDRLMSRVASSLLTNLGLQEFIATSAEGYIQTAITAITNTERLKEVRQILPGAYADWVQRADYLAEVEDLYRFAWRKWCNQ